MIYARSRSLKERQKREPNYPARIVGLLLIAVALAAAIALNAHAGVGDIGGVGSLMSPVGAGPGGEPGPPATALVTEAAAPIITEDDLFLLTEA